MENADAFRAALAHQPWDVILADYALPHFSADAAVQVLKDSGQDIPLIIVSGTISEEDAIRLMRHGASDFVFKQNMRRLIPAVQREIAESRERRQAAATLAQERQFLATAIDLLPFPIIINATTGEVLRANRAGYTFFGDLSTANWWRQQLLSAQTHQPVASDQWPMMRAAQGQVIPPTEGILVLPDGREVDVLAVAAPISLDNRVVATVVAFIDITGIKEADRAKTRFLAVLSHELRTPLANILGWAKLAQDAPEMAPEALRIILRNADVQYRMLENLLEISRWLYGKLDLRREPIDLWHVVEEALATYRPLAAEHQLTLEVRPPSSPLPISADRKRIREVIDNLLDNAISRSEPDGRIEVEGASFNTSVQVRVHDTSRDITPTRLAHLFDLFQAAPEMEIGRDGLELGLPLVKILVEQHGGTIVAASRGRGQGSTYIMTLPRRDVE